MLKTKIFKNIHVLMSFSLFVLLAFGCGASLMAEEPSPEKEQVHLVGFPSNTKLINWTKTSNKEGMKVIFFSGYDSDCSNRLALVREDGTIVNGYSPRVTEIIQEVIWLNDLSFLCFMSDSDRCLYDIYTVVRQGTGAYDLIHFFSGCVNGACRFVVEGDVLKIMLRDVSVAEITIPIKE